MVLPVRVFALLCLALPAASHPPNLLGVTPPAMPAGELNYKNQAWLDHVLGLPRISTAEYAKLRYAVPTTDIMDWRKVHRSRGTHGEPDAATTYVASAHQDQFFYKHPHPVRVAEALYRNGKDLGLDPHQSVLHAQTISSAVHREHQHSTFVGAKAHAVYSHAAFAASVLDNAGHEVIDQMFPHHRNSSR